MSIHVIEIKHTCIREMPDISVKNLGHTVYETMWYIIRMHDIIGMLSVSADIGLKINQISASMPISTDIITNKITACCFLG